MNEKYPFDAENLLLLLFTVRILCFPIVIFPCRITNLNFPIFICLPDSFFKITKAKNKENEKLSNIIYEMINIDSFNASSFQPYSKVVSSFVIIVLILSYIMQRITKDVEISKQDQLLNITVLSYFALNLVLLLPINFLINEKPEITVYIWTTYLILTILFYSCLSILLCKNGKNRKRLHFG